MRRFSSIGNCYLRVGDISCRQLIGVPIGINPIYRLLYTKHFPPPKLHAKSGYDCTYLLEDILWGHIMWPTIKWVLYCFLKEGSGINQLLFSASKNFDPSRISLVKGQCLRIIPLYEQFSFALRFISKNNFSWSVFLYSFWAIILKLPGYVELGSI